MKLTTKAEAHPEVEVLQIDFQRQCIVFKNSDGVCSCPLGTLEGDVPSTLELTRDIESVLAAKASEVKAPEGEILQVAG